LFYLELGWPFFPSSLSEAKKQYTRLKVPVTLVYGDCDWSSSEERLESRDLLNPKKYVELTDTGHFSFLEAPEKAASIIKPW
jgi:pimeloyl-ACP methyl ester carboxylesterase